MSKKIKILLAFLGLLSMCAVAVAGWIYFDAHNQIAEFAEKEANFKKESAYLEEHNADLQAKLKSAEANARQWQGKVEAVAAELNKLTGEHTVLASKYQSLMQEKESLLAKNADLTAQVENLNQLYAQAQQQPQADASDTFLAALLEEKATLEVQIGKLKDTLSGQESRIQELKDQALPLEQLRKEKQALEEKLSDSQKVQEALSNDLLNEKKRRIALEKGAIPQKSGSVVSTLPPTQESTPTVQVEVEEIREEAAGADRPREYASIQLPPIVVKAEEPRAAAADKKEIFLPRLTRSRTVEVEEPLPATKELELKTEKLNALEGRIITVNKKHEFVVINLGGDDGVEKGMIFEVYRNEMMVGKVEVIETRRNIAACDIKEVRGTSLNINDAVRR